MSKNRVSCINCDCFLREKVRRNNDFQNRMLCYKCYKENPYAKRVNLRGYKEFSYNLF